MINKELKKYIEENIYPVYDTFDKGHDSNHAKAVVKRSLEYYEFLKDKTIDKNMVFVVGAYHDIGNKIQRKNHAYHSGQILLGDNNLKNWFNQNQIQIMAEACEDHSTSSQNPPRTIYGKIVSDADKDIDVEIGLKRGWDFACKHYPNYSTEQKIEDLHREMALRFMEGGSVVFYISSKKNEDFLKQMRAYANDKEYFKQEFLRIANKNNWL